MNRFSVLISTHEILNLSELTVLELNYVFWFIHTHYNLDSVVAYNADIKLIPFDIKKKARSASSANT